MNVKRITTILTTLAVAAGISVAGATAASASDIDATMTSNGQTVTVDVAKPKVVERLDNGAFKVDVSVTLRAPFVVNTDPTLIASGADIFLGKRTSNSFVQVVPKLTKVSDDGKTVTFTKRVHVTKKEAAAAGGVGRWHAHLVTATVYDQAENYVSRSWNGPRGYGKVVEKFTVK